MRLNISILSDATQKQVGQRGTSGTPSVYAASSRPTKEGSAWDTVGQNATNPTDRAPQDPKMSHLSHQARNEVGHAKPSVYAAVPRVPPVPPKNCMKVMEGGNVAERVAIVPPLTRKDELALRAWLKEQGETDPVLIAEIMESARHNVQWRAAEIAAYKSDPANYCGHGALWLANLGCPQ